MHFAKYQSAGNDYLVVDPDQPAHKDALRALGRDVIRRICDRQRGVGADGILFGPLEHKTHRGSPWYRLRIFNPDGSEAEKSGNGLRIFAAYLRDHKHMQAANCWLQVSGGLTRADLQHPQRDMIGVQMGNPVFQADRIGWTQGGSEDARHRVELLGQSWQLHGVGMGNPHCVIPMQEKPGKDITCALGPLVEKHSLFRERTNVQLMQVLDKQRIYISIWERGAGYTLSSGSSACAASAAAERYFDCAYPMTVDMPGGQILVIKQEQGLLQQGLVHAVCTGQFAPALLLPRELT